MAPKRKRKDDAPAETTTRATRRSTRNKAAEDAEIESTASGTTNTTVVAPAEPPPAKKTRKAPAKAGKAAKGGTQKATNSASADADGDVESTATHTNDSDAPSRSMKTSMAKATRLALKELQPYSPSQAHSLFEVYADTQDPMIIGPEGLEQLFSDTEISMDGAMPLIFAWLSGAHEMAKITLKEWEALTGELQISCLASLSIALHDFDDLLLSDKPVLKPPQGATDKRQKAAVPEPYDRRRYHQCARDRRVAFKSLYSFCFAFAKSPQARVIEIEIGSAFWSVLLAPQFPLMQELLRFLEERKSEYKGVNKDQWSMVYDFCLTVKPSLEGYEDDGAWPSMLDAFIEWKKNQPS